MYSSSYKLVTFATTLSTSLFLAGLFILQAHAQTITEPTLMTEIPFQNNISHIEHSAPLKTTPPSIETPMQEVHIANNGLMLLRGARVIRNEGTHITVEMSWGTTLFSWNIQTDDATKYFTRKGEKESLHEVMVGSNVSVTGTLEKNKTQPTINAEFVHSE